MKLRDGHPLALLLTLFWLTTAGVVPAEVNPAGELGKAPVAPTDLKGLPGGGPRPNVVTGGFSVNSASREQVREFYNAVYTASAGLPINSTAVTSNCVPGTNSPAFINATLRRINWYRALAGLPAAVTFDSGEGTKDQQAAQMMSAKNALQHVGDWTGWSCVTADATNASGKSNLALGNNGPDAVTAYIWDFGANNYEVGHRRWILYPQTQIMATGDVPTEGTNLLANATWVFDANYGGSRPATRTPYVPWPPAGYVPYQVVFPQWSFALSNAVLNNATVTMSSNGVSVPITVQPNVTGYGENTLVWYPTGLDPTTSTTFPFGGTDTVYGITVSNVVVASHTNSYAYTVTVFDPATTGTDYSPLVISGTNQPTLGVGNPYTCTISTNPALTGYQWLVATTTNGALMDNALNGLTNFTISPAPIYPTITNPPTGSGNCFHLTHLAPVPQYLQLKETLFPTTTTTLAFKSLLGYATPTESARVQVSVDGGATWQDIYAQAGTTNGPESVFTQHSLSLASYANQATLIRFNYDFSSGTYYPYAYNNVGWCLENVVVTNTQQILNVATNATSSTNFAFLPTQAGNYVLQARGVVFNEFTTDLGTAKLVTAVPGPPLITIKSLLYTNSLVKIAFTLTSGVATNYHLLQASLVNGPWTTNGTATLTTNVPGSSYQFTTTNGVPIRFYRVQTP